MAGHATVAAASETVAAPPNPPNPAHPHAGGWVFAYFRENGEDGLHLAWSRDGLNWKVLRNYGSFLKPEVGGKLMRDPCIIQGPDGMFHMVWTTSWANRGIGIAHSTDLVHWSQQEFVPVMEHEKTAKNCWAPEITWDSDKSEFIIYWATTIPGRFQETEAAGDKGWNHRLYCTTTKDFKTYSGTRLFYDPGFNSIDATIVKDGANWVMVLKDETKNPPAKNFRIATSAKLGGLYSAAGPPFSPSGLWVEGPTCARIGDAWYVYFDSYRKGAYGAMRTRDFTRWEDVSSQLVYPQGCVMELCSRWRRCSG